MANLERLYCPKGYWASISDLNPIDLTPTDVMTISGSNTSIIRVARILISGSRSGSGAVLINVIKRNTLNSGGTSTTIVAGKLDSLLPDATATVKAYTANPTSLGTLDFQMVSTRFPFASLDEKEARESSVIFDWLDGSTPIPLILRGPNESLCINLAGVTIGSFARLDCSIFWLED